MHDLLIQRNPGVPDRARPFDDVGLEIVREFLRRRRRRLYPECGEAFAEFAGAEHCDDFTVEHADDCLRGCAWRQNAECANTIDSAIEM